MTLKTGVMMLEILNKLNLTIYYNRTQLFCMVIIFHNITVFAVLNKRSLGEQKRLLNSSVATQFSSTQ